MTNINADVLAINSVRGDEYFTLEKDVRTIADNLIPDLNIWCPFDEVLKMPTHNGISKSAMLEVVGYLLNLAFDVPEESGVADE